MADPERDDGVVALLGEIEGAWQSLLATVDAFTDEQMVEPTDAAGWTVQDHLAHLEGGDRAVSAMLRGEAFHDGLGVDADLYATGDWDRINAVIRERDRAGARSIEDVRSGLQQAHATMVAAIGDLSSAQLAAPIDPRDSTDPDQIPSLREKIAWNTSEHYPLHEIWIALIAQGDPAGS